MACKQAVAPEDDGRNYGRDGRGTRRPRDWVGGGPRPPPLFVGEHPDLVVLIHHELRYSKYFGKIKELVDGVEIGEVQLVWCKEFRGPFLKKVGDWIQDERLSGGTLVDKNCHHFDLMNWWVGARPKRVCGFGGNDVVHVVKNQYEVIDHASVSFEYENGVRGTLDLCMFALD